MTSTLARRRSARFSRAAAVAAVAAVVTTGCSSPDTATQGNDGPVEQTEGSSFFGEAAGSVDTINWGLPYGEPPTVDPVNGAFYSASLVSMQMCEPLMRLNDDYSLTPLLAESFDQPDPQTLVYTLRDDVTFWDGSPMTAEDVVWSLEHARNPSAVVSFLYANVDSIEATADNEVTVKLTKPDNLMVYTLATFSGTVMEKAFSEAAGDSVGTPDGGLMCTGPMKFDSWESGQSLTLARNADYWDPDHAANTDKIVFSFTSDSSSLAQALTSGELDGAFEVPPAVIPNLQDSDAGQVLFGEPSTLNLGLSLFNTEGPLGDPEVRRAFYSTIDREALASVYHGAASPNLPFMTRGWWDNNAWSDDAKAVFQERWDAVEAERGDWGSPAVVEQARKDAEAAGYNGEPIVLQTLAGDATLSQVAQVIQAEAQAAGFNVQIQQSQPIDYANAGYDPAAREGLDMQIGISFANAPSPVESMQFSVVAGSPYNYTNYSNPEITDLLDTAWQTDDQVEAANALVQIEKIYMDQYLSENLLQLDEVAFVSNDLSGVMTSFPYLNNASVARIGAAQ